MTTAPSPPQELTRKLARKMLGQMGENGKPPEFGISHVNVGNESYLQIIRNVYVEEVVRDTEGSSFKLVQGTYGAGKTHFLYCVRDLAWRSNLLTAFVTISPRECPLNKPLSVYRAVARSLELAPSGDAEATRGIDDVLRRRAEEMLAADGREAALQWVETRLARAPLTSHAFRDALIRYLRAVIEGEEDSRRRMAAWLRGEELPRGEAKAEGVYEVPTNDNGFSMLRSLLQTVHRLEYEGSVLLLDEAERRLSIDAKPNKATMETVDHLRELIDMCGRSDLPRTLIFYAVTPAFTQNLLPLYPALQQRLGSPVQYLSSYNPKAPLIDLEALDMEPVRLLTEIGQRLVRVARAAYDGPVDDAVTRANLDLLARTVTEEQLEVSHRRLFVKLWIRLLDELRAGTSRTLDEDDARALVRDEQAHLLGEEPDSEALQFFGQEVPAADHAPPTRKRKR